MIKGSRHQDVLPYSCYTTHTWSFHSTNFKKKSYKHFTQLYCLPSELLHNIYLWYVGIARCNKIKQLLVRLIQLHPVFHLSTSDKLIFVPFDYLVYCDHIRYVWADRLLSPHKSNHKWGKMNLSNMISSNALWPFKTSRIIQRLISILKKFAIQICIIIHQIFVHVCYIFFIVQNNYFSYCYRCTLT